MTRRSATRWRQVWLGAWIATVWPLASAQAVPVTVTTRVTYQVPEGIYVEAGKDQGLHQGLAGTLRLEDGRVFQFEVLHVASKTSLLRLTGPAEGQDRLASKSAELIFESQTGPEQAADKGKDTPPTTPDQPAPGQSSATPGDKAFVPLLAPVKPQPGASRQHDLFHGRAQVRQMIQSDSGGGHEYLRSLFDSSGSVERIKGTGWSLEWAGALSYRDGDAMRSSPDYQEPRLDLYMASVQHPLAEGGFLRGGRFLPHELPAVGYVDGLQGETRWSDHVRVGVLAGLKPGRQDLAASADEPMAGAYTTLEAGRRDGRYYSGTVGLLGSLYDGQTDRLSVLMDQRIWTGPLLNVYSTAEVDLDVGSARFRGGPRLTRLDLFAVSRPTRSLSFRAGVDHWERPDRLSERALLAVADPRYFDDGYWRYWVGGQQDLPWRLRLSEEISFITASESDTAPRWQIGLTRSGLFAWTQASSTVTVYNLEGAGAKGYGARYSGFLPLFNYKLIVQPEAGVRLLTPDAQSGDLSLTYASLRLDGRFSKRWSLFAGFTYTTGDISSNLLDAGLRYTW